jgi:hypothetical protein
MPLRLLFPKLYEYSSNKNETINDCFDAGERKLDFCRSFGQEELNQWNNMIDLLQG